MSVVHYIGWYIAEGDEENYTGNIPGMLKMRYVLDMLLEAEKTVKLFSLGNRKARGIYGLHYKEEKGCKLCYSGGISYPNKLSRSINMYIKLFQFVLYVLFKVKKDDTILLYHSTVFTNVLAKLKKIVKRKVIIEVEEVYGYSAVGNKPWVQREISSIKEMDRFILVNDGMKNTLQLPINKCVTSYGVGFIPIRKTERFNDGRIHVVYAGTIELRKKGAFTAVDAAEFLPDNYQLHIVGFGDKNNLEALQLEMQKINNRVGREMVRYEGFFSGEALSGFLFKCHIGLSSCVIRPDFANHSFPSKVVTYMCHDLSVVLGYAEAFYDVPLSQGWSFYYQYEPEKIAKAIMETDIKPVGYFHDAIHLMNRNLINFLKQNC